MNQAVNCSNIIVKLEGKLYIKTPKELFQSLVLKYVLYSIEVVSKQWTFLSMATYH